MKKRPANKAFALLLSMLLCASLATMQVPWAAYAVDEEEPSAGPVEVDIDSVDDNVDENGIKLDELDADEEEVLDEAELTLLGNVICFAGEAAELEDEEQQDNTLVAQANGDIASGTLGTYGECNWTIDSNGTLIITPGATGNSFNGNFAVEYNRPPWYQWSERITSIQIPRTIHASGHLEGLFSRLSSLSSADLSGLETSSVVRMDMLFSGCSSLTSLDLSGFNTSSVTAMSGMFGGCSSLQSLDLSSFDTSSVMDMAGMFNGCSSLTSLDLSGFDTSGVTYMLLMFDGCSSLDIVKLGSKFSFKGANDLTGDYLTTLPERYWLSDDANKNQIYTASHIAQDRNDLADTYIKVNLVKDVSVTGIDAPTSKGVAKPVGLTLQAANGVLATNAVTSSWQGDFAKDSAGNDVFVAGNTYTLPVNVALGNRSVRDNGFALSAPDGFTVTPGAYSGTPVGPMGQTYAFTLSYTIPPAVEHVVTLDPGNGDAATNVDVADGEKLRCPADPTREGYRFDGWLLDGKPYDFDAPVTSNMALTAKWVKQEAPVVTPDEPDPEPSPAPTGLPPKTLDTIGLPAGLILLACVLIASMVGINRRKAYEAAKNHFHYERYAYLNERKRSPFRWFWR